MVFGRPADPDSTPLDFIEAARMWVRSRGSAVARSAASPLVAALGKAQVREAVCAGNEGALKRVRDTSENGMTVCAAVRSLEQLNEAEDVRSSGRQQLPGLTIIIQNTAARRAARCDAVAGADRDAQAAPRGRI